MQQQHAKAKKPTGSGNAPLEMGDAATQAPNIKDTLDDIEQAIQQSYKLEQLLTPRRCGCG